MLQFNKYSIEHGILLVLSLIFLTACSPLTSGMNAENLSEEMDHEGEMDIEEEIDHEEKGRVPNKAASIHIFSPNEGATFSEGDEVRVEVEVDQFALGEDGNHWHVYVDGVSWGMVTGGRTNEVLRGLEPGEREIEVYLTGGDHIELEEGDSINISIE